LHTNFKGANWKWSIAKDSDVRKRLSYDQMVKNDVFRISEDMKVENKEHSLELFVSPGYQYNEYDAVGDELWIVEMVVKVYSFHILVHTNTYHNTVCSYKIKHVYPYIVILLIGWR